MYETTLIKGSTVEHLEDFISNISSLFQRPELSDLTLVIEGQDVRVNRSILAARSEYFHALLFNGMKESQEGRIELPTVDLKSFRLILKFIYSGKLPLSPLSSDELAELLISARFFCLERLVCDIALYLRLHINKNNVWLLYKVSKSFYIDQLAIACERFFDKNAEAILQHEEFYNLDVEELKEMVTRDSFYAPEKAILRAICNYYSNNVHNKTPIQCLKLLKKLLEPVRLSLMTPSDIRSIFSEFELPMYDPAMEDYYNIEKHRSALPIQQQSTHVINTNNNSINAITNINYNTITSNYNNNNININNFATKRPSNHQNKSPTNKKKLKLTTPVLTVAFDENKVNILPTIPNVIENINSGNNNDNNTKITGLGGGVGGVVVVVEDHICLKQQQKYFTTQCLTDITSGLRQKKETIRGYLVYNKNIATKEYNVEPLKGRLKKDLVCSTDRNYNIRTCTNHTMPHFGSNREEFIQVAFGRPFIVNNIRMLLLDDGQRSFSYIIEVSTDNRVWTKIIDYSKYWCRSWQHLFFKERVVKHVRITGTRSQFYGQGNSQMSVVYFDCMYNTLDEQMYSLTDDGSRIPKSSPKKAPREYFVEPKSSVVEMNNTIALTSSSNGTMRHFRLMRGKTNSPSNCATNLSIPTSPPNPHQLSTGALSSLRDTDWSFFGSNPNPTPLDKQLAMHYYRTTDFARGSANWNGPGKVIFQLAQPFKISSFAFNIVPSGGGSSSSSHSTISAPHYRVSISNDMEHGSWKLIKDVVRLGSKDLTVVEFEPQIVTFIEIRSIDYPTISHFSVKHFECPYVKEPHQA